MDVSRIGPAASSPEPLTALARDLKAEMSRLQDALKADNPEAITASVLALHTLAGEASRC